MEYPRKRNLDGVYYHVERDGVLERLCFSDLTLSEQRRILNDMDVDVRERLCLILSNSLRGIGDLCDVVNRDKPDDRSVLSDANSKDGLVTISVEVDSDLYIAVSAMLKEQGLTVEGVLETFIRFCALSEDTETIRAWWDAVKNERMEGTD